VMRHLWTAAIIAAASPLVAVAQTDFGSMTAQERAAFRHEVRQALMDAPELVLPAFRAPPPPTMQAGISADNEMLARLGPVLFSAPAYRAGPEDAPEVALISTPDCPACDTARQWLEDQAKAGQLQYFEWALSAAEIKPLELDVAPSFVFGNVMLRGDMPPVVLEKYLRKMTR